MVNATNATITNFKLDTSYSWSNIDSWLRLVAKSNIKELDLNTVKCGNVTYGCTLCKIINSSEGTSFC